LVWGDTPAQNNHRNQVSLTDALDWRAQNHVFEDVVTYGAWQPTLSGVDAAESVFGMKVGDGYFSLMRATPILGRAFLPEDHEPGKGDVVILSNGLWQRRFGGDPNIIGKTILLDLKPVTVVGVLPASLASLPVSLIGGVAEIYGPIAEKSGDTRRGNRHLRAIARLKPGVTFAQAQADMNVIAHQLEQDHLDHNRGYGIRLVTIGDDTVGNLRPALLMLLGAVTFVLLIACSNVGNLLLSRASTRKKEIAVRASLGASRSRLIRQMLTESMLLAAIGGIIGVVLASTTVNLLRSVGGQVSPLLKNVEIDTRVLLFAMSVSLITGIVFGLAPALHGTKLDLNQALREGGKGSGSGSGHNRLRSLLVVTEFSMAMILLISAGLVIKSIVHLYDVNPGFETRNLATLQIGLLNREYPEESSWTPVYDRLNEKLKALPGVLSVAEVSVLPLGGNFDGRTIVIEGQQRALGDDPSADLYEVTPDYLQTMAIPVLKGRGLTSQDNENAPFVALISQSMANTMWPGQDPIGKRLRYSGQPNIWRTVVGIVADVRQYGLDQSVPPQFYLPEAQDPTNFMFVAIRTTTDPAPMLETAETEIHAVDKDLAIYSPATMDQLLASSTAVRRFSMFMMGLFAATALILAAVGIYGVISYSVTQRYQEIGIRIALGLQKTGVLKLVLGQAMTLVSIGVTVGLIGSYATTRLMATLLYGVSTTDVATFAGVALLLSLVALAACYFPASRAAKVDPIRALKYE